MLTIGDGLAGQPSFNHQHFHLLPIFTMDKSMIEI